MTIFGRKALILLLGLSSLAASSCTPEVEKERLEVSGVRYEASGSPLCAGEVKNISSQEINNLQVEVEFQNGDSNRVRVNTGNITPAALAPNMSGNFSVPYVKGSNDPAVVTCKPLKFKSPDSGPVLHLDKSSAKSLSQ
jgi:hypothetical protein